MSNRSSGILMHISSLPSPYGIGTLGKEAYEFADFLHTARQKYWQVLPISPCDDSPYSSCSAFAGNPYFIDLDTLIEEGLLTKTMVNMIDWGSNPKKADYAALRRNRLNVLRQAYYEFKKSIPNNYYVFLDESKEWLPDYALYMSLKDAHKGKAWPDWGEARFYDSPKVEEYRSRLRSDIEFYCFVQYKFFEQWTKLKRYVNKLGIKILGDIPIYVPMDSVDVWARPHLFQLDEKRRPKEVAGVPPDYFSADGQLWGNPLYDWDEMEKDGYSWWLDRIRSAAKLCDAIRIDHFRGLASYWSVPFGNETARDGKWVVGPGKKFIDAVKTVDNIELIAEDLGVLTADVTELLEYSGFPGMKVLQFGFDPSHESDYLPHRYERNCICYTGTHDNATIRQWLDETGEENRKYAAKYLGLNENEGYIRGIIRGGMSSVAKLFVAQIQDWLELGGEARMNLPGTVSDSNWSWRAEKSMFTEKLAKEIGDMTRLYGRK